MKNEVIISSSCSKQAFSAKRLTKTFNAHSNLSFNIYVSAAYRVGGIMHSFFLTRKMTQVSGYVNGLNLDLNSNKSVWKNLLHMEYCIKSLVKPEPIQIRKAKTRTPNN